MLTRKDAIAWFKHVPDGTYEERMEYLEKFGAGVIAMDYWNDALFTFGIEYGILIALAKVFDLKKEDIG